MRDGIQTMDGVRDGVVPGFSFSVSAAVWVTAEPVRVRLSMPFDSMDDALLFARIRDGDEAAFAEFYDRHSALLYGVALRILRQEHDAEDVLQEALIALWERAPQYNPALGQPLGWAVALTRNKAIDRLRSIRRRSEVMDAAAQGSDVPSSREAPFPLGVLASESGEFVNRALDSLSSEQRRAIELAFFSGLTQQEIALRLGEPLGTVKARIRRGMLALRDWLEGQA
ncbi:MAG: sigma-70 family RNA polymerase sigma factor [Verrucomicrobiae bacterium]|nr:sigma-70 family RNA polymerase sigma factor [Verrucomicrobiae bacterium]